MIIWCSTYSLSSRTFLLVSKVCATEYLRPDPFPMDYDYNRKAFRSTRTLTGLEPLAFVYCSCILLELGLKQHLGFVNTLNNGGHNLPKLLQQVSVRHPQHKVVCDALKTQLEGALMGIFCQGKKGAMQKVPPSSYPHIRYIRHSSDWPMDATTDAELASLKGLIERIFNHLTKSVKWQL